MTCLLLTLKLDAICLLLTLKFCVFVLSVPAELHSGLVRQQEFSQCQSAAMTWSHCLGSVQHLSQAGENVRNLTVKAVNHCHKYQHYCSNYHYPYCCFFLSTLTATITNKDDCAKHNSTDIKAKEP